MVSKPAPLVWHVHEYVYREKSPDWYWAVGIIAVSMAVTAILFNDVLFALFIAIAFIVLMMYAKRKPRLQQIKIDDRGIEEGRVYYHYSSIDSFWVEDRYGEQKIILKSKKKTMPYIVIPIVDVNANDVRDRIRERVPEEEHAEPIARRIMEYLGF